MEPKQIPQPLLQEIERRAVQYIPAYESSNAMQVAYANGSKYWVGRMLAEREATEKALTQLRDASNIFMLKQKFGGNLKEFRNGLTAALWEADKVLNSIIKVEDQNKKAEKKTQARPFYIAAIDNESGNYFPKELPATRLKEATDEGHFCHTNQADAQKECDQLNAQ